MQKRIEKSREEETDNDLPNEEILKKINELEEEKVELVKRFDENTKKLDENNKAYLELEDMLKRRVAEFENFKRRTDKEKIELLEYGNVKLLARFIDLIDNLQNAVKAANSATDLSSVQQGIEMIYQKVCKQFEDEGVRQIEVNIGDEFDVEKHEALMQQPSDLPEGCITMVVQSGYIYKDKVLRYAKVATSSGPSNNQVENQSIDKIF